MRIFPVLLVIGAACGAMACGASAQPGEPPIFSAPLQPLTPSGRGVVFPGQLAREFGQQCSRRSPVGYWTPVSPSKNEVKRLESALPRWMSGQKIRGWDGHFASYYFQYGALVRGKKRLIYLNVVPAPESDGRQVWRRGPEVVCDGGPNFWGAEFDPQSGKFQNFDSNGMA